MVLWPIHEPPEPTAAAALEPAWPVVERKQMEEARSFWLVAQDDHAQLAGDMAAAFDSGIIPALDAEVLQGIALHDFGWAEFDRQQLAGLQGSPVTRRSLKSFLDFPPRQFTRVWEQSIDRASEAGPLAATLVSRHFFRLGQTACQHQHFGDQDAAALRTFFQQEEERMDRLARQHGRSKAEVETLVDVLQFCDLLSLYLCSGSKAAVEFPQSFGGRRIRVRPSDGAFRLDPSPFSAGVSLGIRATHFPANGQADASLPILLI